MLEVGNVICGEVRRKLGIGNQRFSARGAAYAFQHSQGRDYERMVRRDKAGKVGLRSAIGKQVGQTVGAGLDYHARIFLSADVNHRHLSTLMRRVNQRFDGLSIQRWTVASVQRSHHRPRF